MSATPILMSPADFLAALLPDVDYAEGTSTVLFALPSKALSHAHTPTDYAGLLEEARAFDVDSQNVYIHAALHDKATLGGRGSEDSATALLALFDDIDVLLPGHSHKSGALPRTIDEALDFVSKMPWPATFVVHTGFGLQAWWIFKEPLVLDEDGRETAKTLLAKYAQFRDTLASSHGWKFDSVHDLARVLRMPGSRNLKNPDAVRDVNVIARNDVRYNPSDLLDALPALLSREITVAGPPLSGPALDNQVANLVRMAKNKAHALGRNPSLLWLSCQLRDAGLTTKGEILAAGAGHVGWLYKNEPNRDWQSEFEESTYQALKRPPRNPLPQQIDPMEAAITKIENGDEGAHPSDLGNRDRFVAQHHEGALYVYKFKSWYVFDGVRWHKDDGGEAMELAVRTVRDIYKEASDADDKADRREGIRHGLASEKRERISSMLALAQSPLCTKPDELDTDPWLFNVQNGTLDLRTGELLPHRREDFITKLAPVTYDPDAKCPLWDSVLQRIFDGNTDLIDFVQRAVGYSLTGKTDAQCFFLLHGTGQNGKSTILETLREITGEGEYAQQAEFSTFLEKDGDGVRNDIADLKGARLVMAVEPDVKKALSESVIKSITGSDMMKARFLYQEYFAFKPELKLWLAANHKPTIKGTDLAIWRRIKLIPFNVTIPEEERDDSLVDKLTAKELPGILTWAVRGCLEWQRQKNLNPPKEVTDATDDYRADEDQVGRFISERCERNPQATTKAGDLFADYKTWCDTGGESKSMMSARTFGQRLGEMGFKKGRGNRGRFWEGVRLMGGEVDHDA